MDIVSKAAFSIFALFYLFMIIGGIVLLIWGFVTVLRIQKNTRETNALLSRVMQLLEQNEQ